MATEKPLLERRQISELLYHDEEYVRDFIAVSIDSFSQFNNHFATHLKNRDEQALREAGHKIKPVAKILKLDPIVEMYEESKTLVREGTDAQIEVLSEKMDDYCSRLIGNLKNMQ